MVYTSFFSVTPELDIAIANHLLDGCFLCILSVYR